MRVLAVDPGYDRLGVAVIEHATHGEELLYSSCIETSRDSELADRLLALGDAFEQLIAKYTPDAIAVETLFFNANKKTMVGVAQARGIVFFLAKRHGCRIYEFGPQEVKVAVTGYGKSDKHAVIDMVQKLVRGVPEQGLDDEYDAIAVGVTCLAHHRT